MLLQLRALPLPSTRVCLTSPLPLSGTHTSTLIRIGVSASSSPFPHAICSVYGATPNVTHTDGRHLNHAHTRPHAPHPNLILAFPVPFFRQESEHERDTAGEHAGTGVCGSSVEISLHARMQPRIRSHSRWRGGEMDSDARLGDGA
jgi:hypothetical protein